jgi:hypothetical protein
VGIIYATLAGLIRPQYFVFVILLYIYHGRKNRWIILYSLFAILIFGLIDLHFTGVFLGSIINLYHYNFQLQIMSLFGTLPWWQYLYWVIVASAGAWLFIKRSPLIIPIILTLLIHSVLPHKEYRFIFVIIPALIISMRQRWIMILPVISLISLFYLPPRNEVLDLYNITSQQKEVCNLFDAANIWVNTGGYTYLQKNVPLYSTDYPPPDINSVSHFIINKSNQSFPDLTIIASTDHYVLYKNPQVTACVRDPNYTYYRSFPGIESKLKQI